MAIDEGYSFQCDSDAVQAVYKNDPNFIIETDPAQDSNYCIIYFSSNDVYFPNTEVAFKEQLLKKNRFEWYGNRISYGKKHIFIRDIQKQWYLTGINGAIDNPERLLSFLREQTTGFDVITVGASAGGFAAVLYGQQLQARQIFSFNGQFEIRSLLHKSSAEKDPIIFRKRNDKFLAPYYDSTTFITSPESIYYFRSTRFPWDIEQNAYAKSLNINRISFSTSNHGIPFLRSNLKAVLNLSKSELANYRDKTFHPIIFSLKMVGLPKTAAGLTSIVKFGVHKLYIKTFLKFKESLLVHSKTKAEPR